MFRRKPSDLHMHLNGSIDLFFLEGRAKKNHADDAFIELKQVKEEYKKLIAKEDLQGIHDKSIALIWKQFSLIHKIMQTLSDIKDATVNVMDISKASYMEIRTTPKDMNSSSWKDYVNAFVNGLKEGNEKHSNNKLARGLLSLDRTIHSEQSSYEIIDQVAFEQKRSGLLVGIDISGNPMAERKLTDTGLVNVLNYALKQDIGVAIHIGEVDTEVEKNDVNVILDCLTAWAKTQPSSHKNCFHGKVRLGHGIFLTEDQRTRIKECHIPIEICPSCHEKLNWWNKSHPHPVTHIYKLWKDPVVSGTDDEFIFGGSAKEENLRTLEILGFPKDKKKAEAREHQSQFRFTK